MMNFESSWDDLVGGLNKMEAKISLKHQAILLRVQAMLPKSEPENEKARAQVQQALIDSLTALQARMSSSHHKRATQPGDLSLFAAHVYKYICEQCPTDAHFQSILTLISNGPIPECKISGRMMDTVMTAFAKFRDTSYYLDVSDAAQFCIVDYIHKSGRTIILFDVSASYKAMMRRFSKAYFDCFGRGDETLHTLKSGRVVRIILCQFTYFIWAKKYCVFDFIKSQLPHVITIRQHCQRSKYIPKKRKRKEMKPIESNKRHSYVKLAPLPTFQRQTSNSVVVMKTKGLPQIQRRLRYILEQKPRSILEIPK